MRACVKEWCYLLYFARKGGSIASTRCTGDALVEMKFDGVQ